MNNKYQRIARSISSQKRWRFFCSSSSSPCLLMPPAIDDKGLIIPSSSNKNKAGGWFNMYNLIQKKMIRVPKLGPGAATWKADVLCPQNALCVGSSNGWLAFVNPQNQSMFLLNPLINNSNNSVNYIPLPPVETLPLNGKGYRMFKSDHRSATPSLLPYFVDDYYSETGGLIQKLLLSMPPSASKSNSCIPASDHDEKGGRPYNNNNNNCFVAVLKRGTLSYCLLGDKQWYRLYDYTASYEDIIYSPRKKTLFAIGQEDHHDCIYTWDFTDPLSPKKQSLIRTHIQRKEKINIDGYNFEKRYLVESEDQGDLFLVVRYVGATSFYVSTKRDYCREMPYRTVLFDVYKLVNNTWKPLKSLGDHRAIFVGINSSYCLNTSGLIQGNRIYYTDDSEVNVINVASDDQLRGRGHDFGVFDYGAYKHVDQQDFILNQTRTSSIEDHVKEFLSPPVWVIPPGPSLGPGPDTTTSIPKNSCYNCGTSADKRNTTCQYIST